MTLSPEASTSIATTSFPITGLSRQHLPHCVAQRIAHQAIGCIRLLAGLMLASRSSLSAAGCKLSIHRKPLPQAGHRLQRPRDHCFDTRMNAAQILLDHLCGTLPMRLELVTLSL